MCDVCPQEYGIPAHYGLLSSLGAAMMMVALLSATYHVCPNALNFQFGKSAHHYIIFYHLVYADFLTVTL